MRSRRSRDPDAFGGAFGPAGVHRAEPAFDRRRYWRGPVWPQLAYLLWLAGAPVADTTVRGAETSGLSEFWDPDDATGLGASPQSWTCLAIVMSDKSSTSRDSNVGSAVVVIGTTTTPRMGGGAALTAHEVDDHVDGRHEDDEITEGDDLLRGGYRDDVGEHDQHVVGFFEVASAAEFDVVLESGFDDTGVHER